MLVSEINIQMVSVEQYTPLVNRVCVLIHTVKSYFLCLNAFDVFCWHHNPCHQNIIHSLNGIYWKFDLILTTNHDSIIPRRISLWEPWTNVNQCKLICWGIPEGQWTHRCLAVWTKFVFVYFLVALRVIENKCFNFNFHFSWLMIRDWLQDIKQSKKSSEIPLWSEPQTTMLTYSKKQK